MFVNVWCLWVTLWSLLIHMEWDLLFYMIWHKDFVLELLKFLMWILVIVVPLIELIQGVIFANLFPITFSEKYFMTNVNFIQLVKMVCEFILNDYSVEYISWS